MSKSNTAIAVGYTAAQVPLIYVYMSKSNTTICESWYYICVLTQVPLYIPLDVCPDAICVCSYCVCHRILICTTNKCPHRYNALYLLVVQISIPMRTLISGTNQYSY